MAAYKHKPIPLDDENFVERFYSKFQCGAKDECWSWKGSYNRNGRPVLSRKRLGKWLAHRVSYGTYFKVDPGDLLVLHKCDVMSCVNPAHLFLGTNLDNTRDMMNKGRRFSRNGLELPWQRGDGNHLAKLNESDVKTILRLVEVNTRKEIASMFGVTASNIACIIRGKSWGHISRPPRPSLFVGLGAVKYTWAKPKVHFFEDGKTRSLCSRGVLSSTSLTDGVTVDCKMCQASAKWHSSLEILSSRVTCT